MLHLNSQAKGPLPDRTLESFLINTEGVISNITGKIFQVKRQGKKFRWNILPFLF